MLRSLKDEKIERVVVRGANWVGDAVMTVPALRELRRILPRAHLTLATRPWAAGVFDGADFIDDLLIIESGSRGPRRLLREVLEWRRRRFDLALILPNSFEAALTAFAARVPVRFGYATEGRGLLLTHPFEPPEWRDRQHEVFYYIHLIWWLELWLGLRRSVTKRKPRLELNVAAERKASAREFLRARGLSLERPLVALCPGSTNSRAKRWPAERFAALADMLAEEAGAEVVLIGSASEREVTEEVLASTRRRPLVLTGETDLAQTLAVLSVADLLVTNDTGPAHLAAAVGTPVVVIFGPTKPETTRPFSPLAEVVRVPPECAPCMLRDCPIDHRCMTAISPRDVLARAANALKRRAPEVA